MNDASKLDRDGVFQHGLVTLNQLNRADVTRQQRRTLVRRGLIVPASHGVFRTYGTPHGWEQDLHSACLAAGSEAVASHRAAALLWELIDPPAPLELTVSYGVNANSAMFDLARTIAPASLIRLT